MIQFAEQHGNCSAQREFGIAESNIRLWRRSNENLEKMPRLQRANRGKKAAWPRLEHGETEQWTGNFADHDQT